jgi:hypothetical protein
MKSYTVIGYTADADIWCVKCAHEVYGLNDGLGEDWEGNPIHPIFAGDENADEEHCGHCGDKLL